VAVKHPHKLVFDTTDEYFEYLLGDLRYMGKDMFVMQCIGKCELAPRANLVAIAAYNKMHVNIFLKTNISFHFHLTRFKTFKVKGLNFKIWDLFLKFWV
jgi:hypothetical protein